MVTIYLSGGMGNQLFQVGFGHYLNKSLEVKAIFRKPKLKTDLHHTKLSFFEVDHKCEHGIYKIHYGNILWNKLCNPWELGTRSTKIMKFGDYRAHPFVGPHDISHFRDDSLYLGYFQNYKFIQQVDKNLRHEINNVLKVKSKNDVISTLSESIEVIHIRQGDTKSPSNLKRVGILDRTFYKNVLEKKTSFHRRVVVTDDVQGAQKVLKGIHVDNLYGPEDLDPWETLSLMAKAKRLITANSTFSWWGGFLALANNAEIVIPEPFFVSSELKTNGAFRYPGFIEAKSAFLA